MLFSGGYKKEPVEWNWLKYWICPSKVGDENTKVAFLDVVLFFFFFDFDFERAFTHWVKINMILSYWPRLPVMFLGKGGIAKKEHCQEMA